LALLARQPRNKVIAVATLAPAKPAVADERRLSLVRAAYDIIAAEGFERLRTRDVADRVGINVGTLHYYFPTKETLIAGVAHYLASQFQTVRAPGTTPSGGSALDRLRQEFVNHDFYQDSRPEMITVMQELNLRGQRDAAIREIMEPLKQAWRANMAALVADGIRDGTMRSDIDDKDAASFIVMALWGTGTLPLEAAARQAVYRAIEEWVSPWINSTKSVSR
jgi:AcrR family transcriptional regulator